MQRLATWLVVMMVAVGGAADEGMWMPQQLPALGNELTGLGLKLDPARLSDLEAQPLAAVVWLGGCTAAFVSEQGLVATNHHCAYGSIHFNSSEEHDYLRDGFLARSCDEELPASPGSRIWVAVETTDVTRKINESLTAGLSGHARYEAIERAEKALVADCEKDPGHRCRVSAYYGGMLYLLTKQLEIRDVRLVYAPRESVGNYGGDIDNWMWPRHTGDYSFLRAYVAPDGSAADPSPDNVPFKPKSWLRVAPAGVAENDLVMVAGYPGSTDRYRLADEVELTFEWQYPRRIAMLERILEVIDRESAGRPAAELAYTAVARYVNNGLKNTQGMLVGYAHSDMVRRKRELEAGMAAWVAADEGRSARWGGTLEQMRDLVREEWATRDRDLATSRLKRGTILSAAVTLVRLAHERQLPDAEREPGYQERDLAKLAAGLERLQRSFDAQVDRALLKEILVRSAALPAGQRIQAFDTRFGLAAEDFDDAALDASMAGMYEATTLPDLETRLGYMSATPQELAAAGDPILDLALALYPEQMAWEDAAEELEGRMLDVRPRFMQAMVAYLESQGRAAYPDANSTLRVTYGTVTGYAPKDGVRYVPFTTDLGLLEKETGEEPFASQPELLEAVRHGDFGPYATADGRLPVNFLSTVDTTGGNSGSPTLDGEGRLVGFLFDGNWESIIADWDYLPGITRSIHADIRYVLWVMDRIDHAWQLLREMGIEPAFAPAEAAPASDS